MLATRRWEVLDTRRQAEDQIYEIVEFHLEDGSRFLAKVQDGWVGSDKPKKYKVLLNLDDLDKTRFTREVRRYIKLLEKVGAFVKEINTETKRAEDDR